MGVPDGDDANDRSEDDQSVEEADEDEEERKRNLEKAEQLKLIKYNEGNKSFIRWRPDDKCSSRVPELPDDTVVECNPAGNTPCCSNLGWCGSTKEHCTCALCIDFRKPSDSQ